ncbi:MAG: hypothetical protein DRH15_11495, partial [Deltaproteobacteria bacterium]
AHPANGKSDLGLWSDDREFHLLAEDHENIYRTIPGGVMPLEGGRVVENGFRDSPSGVINTDDLTTFGGTATIVDSETVTYSVWTYLYAFTPILPSGTKIRISAEIENIDGSGNFSFYHYDAVEGDDSPISISSTAERLTSPAVTSDGVNRIRVGVRSTGGTGSLKIRHLMWEDITGQSNQNPSEYVPVLGDGSPMDGMAYYNRLNGNTVDANGVVTESPGALISPEPYWLHAPDSINYADGDNDLSGGPETIDLTTPGTGDYTLSVYGDVAVTVAAGTADGTGFGQATEGNDVTFNLTTAGTITLTRDSGTLDTFKGAAMKQVEQKSFSTPFIVTSGSPASRDIVQMQHPYSSAYFNQAEGMTVFEYTCPDALADSYGSFVNIKLSNSGVLYHTDGYPTVGFVSYDGTNASAKYISVSSGTKYKVIERHNSTDPELQVGVEHNGIFRWDSTPASYDEAFVGTGPINLGYNCDNVLYIHDLKIYNKDKGTQWIEENF